jgi:hypothetical protein
MDAFASAVQLRIEAVGDHLALLQTDPSYMRRYIRMLSQGGIWKTLPKDEVCILVDHEINYHCRSLYWWLCIKQEAERVKEIHARFHDQIGRGKPLPAEYDQALASLELVLVNVMEVKGGILAHLAQQRPGFAKYCNFRRGMTKDTVTITKNFSRSLPDMLWSDPLFWCVLNLCAGPDHPSSMNHAHLFTFLERQLPKDFAQVLYAPTWDDDTGKLNQKPTEVNVRLDQTIMDQLSDFATTHHLLLAIRLHRPQNKAGDSVEMMKTEGRRSWSRGLAKAGDIGGSPSKRGNILQSFYDAPLPGAKRDATWAQRSAQIQKYLEAYWDAFRAGAKDHMSDAEAAPYLQAKVPDPDITKSLEHMKLSDDQLLQEPALRNGQDDIPEFQPLPPKAKTKTRPVQTTEKPGPSAASPNGKAMEVQAAAPALRIPTTKRAMDLFSKMYPDDPETASKGADWDTFVHAMNATGFSAHGGGGSAVIFEREGEGRIVFHKPHPVAKIDSVMLRAMGKRMAKWFGWSRGCFGPRT